MNKNWYFLYGHVFFIRLTSPFLTVLINKKFINYMLHYLCLAEQTMTFSFGFVAYFEFESFYFLGEGNL